MREFAIDATGTTTLFEIHTGPRMLPRALSGTFMTLSHHKIVTDFGFIRGRRRTRLALSLSL